MSSNPLVSIIIPVKNRPELIQKTLRSVQAQTYPHWEVVVVDDWSTDGTRAAVAAMAAEDERIRLLRRPEGKGGAPVCRNIGWRNAGGDYIIFLDSDDLLAEACLEQRVQIMEDDPEMDFAVFGAHFFDEVPGDREELFNVRTGENPLDRFLKLDLPWQTAGPIYRYPAVEQIGGWNEDLSCAQDIDFSVRALCCGLQYEHRSSVDYFIRTGGEGREKAGDSPWSSDRLPARQQRVEATYRALAETDRLTDQRKLRVAGSFLHLAECWAKNGRIDKARATWEVCQQLNLVGDYISSFVGQYLKYRAKPWASYMAYYMYTHFPSELFLPGRFLLCRSPDAPPKAPRDYPVQHPSSPYFRHAQIMKEGLVKYAIRHLLSSMNLISHVKSWKKKIQR